MRAHLIIDSGLGQPQTHELDAEQPTTLGRHRSNRIVLQDEHASRMHAEVYCDGRRWYVRDNATLNGTRVNDQPITQPFPLSHGQVILIGRTSLCFQSEAGVNGAGQPAAPQTSAPKAETPAELDHLDDTVLCKDELAILCQFMATAIKERDARTLIHQALELIHTHVRAAVTGFLSLDPESPIPKLVVPNLARVDIQLSRRLTQTVQREGRAVWVGQRQDLAHGSESLLTYSDALCLPLLAGETALGALHVYRTLPIFSEREVRFCEVLAGHLANSLHLLRVQRTLEAENSRLRDMAPSADQLIGDSPALRQLRLTITRLATGPATILVVGESGAGKELVAVALHRQSQRAEGPLVSVNCAAIAADLLESQLFGHRRGAFTGAENDHVGLFQQADEGTLFLDEVGELSLPCQAKLLRVLEGKPFRPVGAETEVEVDVRVLAATNRDLEQLVSEKRFRHDLYYRLQGVQIRVPPLRDHVEDIPDLADYFLERLAKRYGRHLRLSRAALDALQAHSWPGNVRQFRSVLENAVALSDQDTLEPEHLRLAALPAGEGPPSINLEELKVWAVRRALQRTRGNQTHAARLLGVARETLRTIMKEHGIEREVT
jgi:Nif-specific regulatory protein